MLAVASAVVSAVAAGVAVVAQQRAAHELGGADRRLLRSRWWLAGTGASVLAVALQAAALSNGPLGMVQALLAGAVAWAAIGETLLVRRVPPPATVLGMGLAVAGTGSLAVLLNSATTTDPGGPHSQIPVGAPVAAVAVLVVLGLWWTQRHPGAAGAPGLALACGAGYGLAAALLAVLARALPADLGGALGDPTLILAAVTLVIVGPTAFVLSQHALARAHHAGPPMTLILLADPVVATATGAVWFGEHVSLDPPTLVGVLLGLGASITGTLLLTDSPAPAGLRSSRSA
ncbi:hypothetical protein [Actinomycetospora sp. NBC_00405]|uniref:hypothetical protein n=1 Tax=Actinomycetospora sp. NBC_00405 TaxID=2975952 RepID=UPI002E1D3E05